MGSSPPTVFRGKRRKYRAASKRIQTGLAEKNYTEVAEIATKMAFATRASSEDTFAVFLAGVQAYQIGKKEEWSLSPGILAERGIREVEKATEHRLRPGQAKTVKRLIQESLKKSVDELGDSS